MSVSNSAKRFWLIKMFPAVKKLHAQVAVEYLDHLFQGDALFWLKSISAVGIPLGVHVFVFFIVGIWERRRGRSFLSQTPELRRHEET